MSSSEKEGNIGDHSSPDITPGQRPPVNPMEDSPAATPNASYEYSNIEHSDMEQDNDSGGQWCISGNRKRVRSDDSLSDSGTARVSNPVSNSLTVVYAPTDSEKKLTSLSSLKVTQALEKISPECILQVRYNQRLNLIAVDVRNGHAAQVLMNNTFLCGIQVRPYSPLSGKTSIGVIHDVDAEVTDEELAQHLRSEAKIANARRLGKSRVVKVVFSGSHLPSHVLLGHVRHSVVPFKEKPIQCHNCGGFGHKKIACKRAQACNRCAENHVPTAEGCMLNFETSSTTAELVAIWAALESIKNITPPTKAVVLTDSRGALQQLRRVATGRPPPSIPRKLPRSEASLLHRLRTGCPHTAKRLHMYRRKTDPGCPTCGDPEDTTHALLLCPTHEDLRKVLLRSYAAVGLPHSTAQELLNPSGTRGIVEKAFRALLQYLRDSELSDRL
ncbi:hypothetical protein HPB47_023867 [Ixodes persulcatus]|uniref:Uncharacterized protein n=1 Tax=Ixodes persulcatus TaxID=34615 RepID=A0AC60Q5S0_IXOPE|nr:hypothetical protein HPB47_023867 [Ixodes persulcatus]